MTLIPLLIALAAAPPPKVEPEAMKALDEMGAFLREQMAMSVKAEIETDEVLDNGQKITMSSTVDLTVQRPNRLRAEVQSARDPRQFFYDGKSLTLFSPNLGYYATVPAPGTLRELADIAADRYDLEMPLADLFYWGTDKSAAKAITSATHVGPSRVGDVDCEQYAFQQSGLDWQIWIEKGGKPLPRKLLLTTTSEKARPEHEVTYTWTLGASGDPKQFTFSPPPGAMKIELRDRQKATN